MERESKPNCFLCYRERWNRRCYLVEEQADMRCHPDCAIIVCFCLWPMLPLKAIQVSVIWATLWHPNDGATGYYGDIQNMLLLEAMQGSVVLLQSESVLKSKAMLLSIARTMSLVWAADWGHVNVHGLKWPHHFLWQENWSGPLWWKFGKAGPPLTWAAWESWIWWYGC